jgi:dimethylaniline monooxygenase (N-oxide forming)
MEKIRTVGIIGAGLSGLVTARTCLEYGYQVILFEKDAELGGVWASSRRYPGVTPQNTKDTYYFSDFPMPAHYPEWPAGEQVQAYLSAYAKKFNVFPLIRFSHEVTAIDFDNNTWTIRGSNSSNDFTEQVDFMVICNGTFSDPFIPPIPGMDSFTAAGGAILHSSGFHTTESCRNRRVLVVGYCKSASDVVTAASETALSAHLVFREPKWKIPRFIRGINMKYILLNRLGEAVIKPPSQHNRMDRFVHKIGLAKGMLSFMERYTRRTQFLDQLGLVPTSGIKDQAFGEISLETPGFFEKVLKGDIVTRQGEIASFRGRQVIFKDGGQSEFDLVIFATGFRQTIPFMPARFMDKLLDPQGNYLLYRHILPAIPALAFVGYNSSIQCPISSEFAALWVCEYLKGRIPKPTEDEILQEGTGFIRWRAQFRPNGASRGLSTMPGTIHHVDLLLREMKAPLSFFSLIPDWLLTINPGRYKKIRKKLVGRNRPDSQNSTNFIKNS